MRFVSRLRDSTIEGGNSSRARYRSCLTAVAERMILMKCGYECPDGKIRKIGALEAEI